MYSLTYEDIFGTALKNTDRRKRFVKISSDQSRFSIWRTWRGTNISKNEIVLDCDGKAVLDGNNNDAVTTLKIKKTNWFDYYWHTDNTAARVSFKVGIVSMLVGTALGVVSLIF
ncbi:MAG: hypothetical protein J5700_06775 [Treponema sp.]|nr:hypothetical protein [Treponema sp.]